MPRQAIASAHAPAAIGPYSQAVRSGNPDPVHDDPGLPAGSRVDPPG